MVIKCCYISVIEVCAETPDRLVECAQNGRNTDWVANNAIETDRKILGEYFIYVFLYRSVFV